MMMIVGILVAAGATAVLVVWASSTAFGSRMTQLRAQLVASQDVSGPTMIELPTLVRTYAVQAGGRVGGPAVMHLRHEAALVVDPGRAPLDITAEQWTGTIIPGILWTAQGSMNGLPVTVLDAFVAGRGELSARVLGTFRVAGGEGDDYDKAELQRYLSELPVHPDAILNNRGLVWSQIDERTVEVTAQSRSGPASLRFSFDAHGDIVRSEAADRPMATSGGTTPTPWHGTFSGYTQFGRYRIPAVGEVGWMLEDGLFTYWRGRIVSYGPADIPAP